ncbi:MAG: hypothetical protein OEM67_00465 [Thermoleophilia bacterium]|nr:hypothetical protein [Thermoleophilia bacterium]
MAIETIVPRWSPLAGVLERLATRPGASVPLPVYRFAGVVSGLVLLAAIACFAAGARGVGVGFAIVPAVAALGAAVFGSRLWERAHSHLLSRRTP